MHHRSLATLFSSATFRTLAEEDIRLFILECLEQAQIPIGRRTTVAEAFDLAYDRLRRTYRNEYFYKNEITKKLLLGRHSLLTTRLLTEFSVEDTKVDVALVNGTSTSYEIKTDYDDWDRLHKQVSASLAVFDHVYVVASEDAVRTLKRAVPSQVGLIALTKRASLSTQRDAKSNRRSVSTRAIFKSLRMSDLRSICESLGARIDGPNTTWETKAWEIFGRLPPPQAHDLMAKALRTRHMHPAHLDFIRAVPHSLKHLSVAKTLPVGRYTALATRLAETF